MVGDIAVAGADEVQHLDDRAVRRHRAAGRERYRNDRRRDHQHEDADAGKYGRPGHRAHALDPGAVIVDARRRRHLRHPGAQCREVERGAGLDARDDDARDRQLFDRQPAAEPRLQQPGRFVLAERLDLDDAGLRPHRLRRRHHVALEIAPGLRAHLNGDFAGDFGLPFRGRCADEQHGAGGDGSEERHDGDDGNQRAAGDRRPRHDRRHVARARRDLRALRPEVHQRPMLITHPTHRCATVLGAAPFAAPHTGPSA